MSKARLRKSLDMLRREVEALRPEDAPVRERMNRLIADLERELGAAGEVARLAAQADALPELIREFEVRHPRLTGVLNEIMAGLSGLGI
jgi:hypothetical protein